VKPGNLSKSNTGGGGGVSISLLTVSKLFICDLTAIISEVPVTRRDVALTESEILQDE
jgi:hypothetical protein